MTTIEAKHRVEAQRLLDYAEYMDGSLDGLYDELQSYGCMHSGDLSFLFDCVLPAVKKSAEVFAELTKEVPLPVAGEIDYLGPDGSYRYKAREE